MFKNHLRWVYAALFITVTSATLIFQNCADQTNAYGTSSVAYLASKTDFAYDVQFDQIAYMSCGKGSDGDSSAYFTFRAGAYGTGSGLMLNSTYVSKSGMAQRPALDQSNLLKEVSVHKGAVPQLAIRQTANYQQIVTASANSTGQESYDFNTSFLPSLDNQDLAFLVAALKGNDGVRYVRTDKVAGLRTEASVRFNTAVSTSTQLRQALQNNTAFLALTYTENQQVPGMTSSTGTGTAVTTARAPILHGMGTGKADASVYGRGFLISFKQPSAPTNSSYITVTNSDTVATTSSYVMNSQLPNNVMRDITEISLKDGAVSTSSKSWYCDPDLQFMILRSNSIDDIRLVKRYVFGKRDYSIDSKETSTTGSQNTLVAYTEAKNSTGYCVQQPDNPNDPRYAIVRKSFKEEDWYVDLNGHCLIPKKPANSSGSCYDSANVFPYYRTYPTTTLGQPNYIDYDLTKACTLTDNGSSTARVCVEWASICYKQ